MSVATTDVHDCGAYLPTTRLRCGLIEGHEGPHYVFVKRTGEIHAWSDVDASELLVDARLALPYVDDEAVHHILKNVLDLLASVGSPRVSPRSTR